MPAAVYPQPGALKSVQRGVITITGTNLSATATVTSVGAKAALVFHGFRGNAFPASITLTNSTTITATRGGQNGTDATVVEYELRDYY